VMAKAHIDCQGELKRNKFNCFTLNMSIYNMATTLTIMMIYIYAMERHETMGFLQLYW